MGSGNNGLYNIVSIVFVALSAVLCIVFSIMFLRPVQEEFVIVPTLIELPTATPTDIVAATLTPFPATFTPTFTPTATTSLTPTTVPSITVSPSVSPTPTITSTAPSTATPDVTATPTVTASATGPTSTAPSPYLFGVQSNVLFSPNTYNSAGCNWEGIGGQVIGLDGRPYTNSLVVKVFSPILAQDLTANTGTNSFYGQGSGFEIQVANAINTNTYFVQLVSRAGTPVSDVIQITFPGTCEQNVALITFQQIREP